ncbi:MAG: AraC family transcriptional regulator [Polyangiaceae bacterium]|nr:AraC family transcriptional regulator [Polyangiaceae bacterium]
MPPRDPGPPRGILSTKAPPGAHEHARISPTSDALAAFVAHFWWVRWDMRGQPPFIAETLPHPTVHLTFEGPHGEVVGVPTGAFRRELSGEGRVFGVKFRPAAFHPWLGTSVTAITDRRLDLSSVFGSDAAPLAMAIAACSSAPACANVAEEFLLARLPQMPKETARVRDLVERMQTDATLTRVESAAALVEMDVRTLQRRFRQLVGVSPKWTIQRYRLHEAAAQLAQPNPPTLAALAADLGYFDQAHFARDFRAVVGFAPSTYLAR